MIDFVAAGRPLDLAAAVKPVSWKPRKLGSSHRARKVDEKMVGSLEWCVSSKVHVWDQIPTTSSRAAIRRTSFGRVLEQWLEAGCFKDSVQPWWLGTMSV